MSNLLNIIKTLLNEDEDPMKTTPASIEKAGGDPQAYKKEKAKKDPKPAKKEKKKPSRRATLGRKDAPPSSNHPDYLKKKLYKRGVKPKGYGKEGDSTEGMSTEEINKTGVRGHEKKIAKKKKKMARETGAANIQLMRDLGVLKTDSRGRVTLAKRKR